MSKFSRSAQQQVSSINSISRAAHMHPLTHQLGELLFCLLVLCVLVPARINRFACQNRAYTCPPPKTVLLRMLLHTAPLIAAAHLHFGRIPAMLNSRRVASSKGRW